LSPNLPIGLSLQQVEFTGKTERDTLKLKTLDVSLSILSLIFLNLGIEVEAEAGQSGELELDVDLAFSDLIAQNFIPSSLRLRSTAFPVGPSVSYALAKVADDQGAGNPIVKELLENIVFEGQLFAD